jgi:hypothetical protein
MRLVGLTLTNSRKAKSWPSELDKTGFLPDFSKKVENIRTGYRYEKPKMGKVY